MKTVGRLRSVWRSAFVGGLAVALALVLVGTGSSAPADAREPSLERDAATLQDQILEGRALVIQHACGGCHGGIDNPAAEGWLAGVMSPAQEFPIGPCGRDGDDTCFMTRPRNLTPHPVNGLGRFSERQIFNALRYGLRPGETADVEITSNVPGEGNFPMFPKYLAPPMPWPAWRHMTDDQLWAIAAYLKHGVKPVDNLVEDSEGPPDFWASAYTPEAIGTRPLGPFPGPNEVEPGPGVDRDRVLRGRQMVVQRDCGGCHGGGTNPDAPGYLAGVMDPAQEFPVGPCLEDPAAPCYMMRPANLTPHPTSGTGRWTEQQLFNAIRHGLRPATAPDRAFENGDVPSDLPLLAPGMPWKEVRHAPDQDIRDLVYYLKHGLKPVDNPVADADRPEEGWRPMYEMLGTGSYPAPPFPTAREVGG